MIRSSHICDGCNAEAPTAHPPGWIYVRPADGGPPTFYSGEFCLGCARVMFQALFPARVFPPEGRGTQPKAAP